MGFEGRYRDLINPDMLDSLAVAPIVHSLTVSNGGTGANIAHSLALLHDRPVLLGVVGEDGLPYLDELTARGIDTSHVHISQFSTATYQGITDSSGCHVGGFYPGAMADSSSLSLEPWKGQNVIVIVSPHDPKAMVRQVEECKKWGLRLCYDVSWQIGDMTAEQLKDAIETAEIIMLNEHEMSMLSKNTGLTHQQLAAKVPVLVTTLGEKGSLIEGTKVPEPLKVGVAKPKQVADPTGAGDAFRSGFLYGYARGWPLQACAQLGALCGTYAIETMGTQSHAFTASEIAERYRSAFNEDLPSELTKEESWPTTKLPILN